MPNTRTGNPCVLARLGQLPVLGGHISGVRRRDVLLAHEAQAGRAGGPRQPVEFDAHERYWHCVRSTDGHVGVTTGVAPIRIRALCAVLHSSSCLVTVHNSGLFGWKHLKCEPDITEGELARNDI